MPTGYLLDTNHASALNDGRPGLLRHVRASGSQGDEAYLPAPVLGEMYAGAYASQHREANLVQVSGLSHRLAVLPFDEAAAQQYGYLVAQLKALGKRVSVVDLQVAAIAFVYGLVVLSADKHFSYIPDLPVENWLTD
jgi:tRNA(fMet)-specific endonuclease VapC